MNALILAAGLGTRLRPWTLYHPKALVPVGGVPMLKRVIVKLRDNGITRIIVNVHHFADQIIDYLAQNDFGVEILVSDESDKLLDTGGAIVKAFELIQNPSDNLLIHNVDILSNADLKELYLRHKESCASATLLCSNRNSSRRLVIDKDSRLKGWHNAKENIYRPNGFSPSEGMNEVAFSGIHILNNDVVAQMQEIYENQPFPVMDYYIHHCNQENFKAFVTPNLQLIDIGKPDTIMQAQQNLIDNL